MSDTLEVTTEGRLRMLRLNRPDRKNALNGELMGAVKQGLREAAADDDVWAIALTAAGSAFCSGLDLAEHGDAAQDESESEAPAPPSEAPAHFAVIMRVECEKPIVAGVNGIAVGAGVSLAMNADVRIAAPSARFHPGYARVGTSPDLGLSWTILRALGYERAMRFLLESRMVSASEALELGMVSEVVAHDDDLGDRVREYGTMLASVAPIAARQTKRLLVKLDRPTDLAGHLDEEIALALHGLSSEDGAEAIRAMFAKEEPQFRGR